MQSMGFINPIEEKITGIKRSKPDALRLNGTVSHWRLVLLVITVTGFEGVVSHDVRQLAICVASPLVAANGQS